MYTRYRAEPSDKGTVLRILTRSYVRQVLATSYGKRAALEDSQNRRPGADRRTFAIISHPDAGKTTLTEKFLLYSGAIQLAGAVKSRKQAAARSDWMELERQRGISVSSTVLGLEYGGCRVNLLDTPGHGDFGEDTYRTLYAVDSALMVLDAAKGIEERTLRLFEVCWMRGIPVITFVNKLDRPSLEPLGLLDQIEAALGFSCAPVTWPVGSAQDFSGVVDRRRGVLIRYDRTAHGARAGSERVEPLDAGNPRGDVAYGTALEELELLSAVGASFDRRAFLRGEQTPVFFGSALSNFGVRLLLDAVTGYAPAPGMRETAEGGVRDLAAPFSGFVFKVQANMDPRHRDRIAFVRVCSGRFQRGMEVLHERSGRPLNTRHAQQLFANERSTLEEAQPGDVVGLVNAGDLAIGDSVYSEEPVRFPEIPRFTPEHFLLARSVNAGRHKQYRRGLQHLADEGALRVLERPETGLQEPVLGAVGPLQFEVAAHRMEHEFGAPISTRQTPWSLARRLDEREAGALDGSRGVQIVRDITGGEIFALFESPYWLQRVEEELGGSLAGTAAAG
jgi:peptide chain release factor 3